MSSGLKRVILWDYPRGVWQYDVICALIVLFIFGAPRSWFWDQPRIPVVSQISPSVFWVEPELIDINQPVSRQLEAVDRALSARLHKPQTLLRLDPIYDSEHELKGYMAYGKP